MSDVSLNVKFCPLKIPTSLLGDALCRLMVVLHFDEKAEGVDGVDANA